MIKMLAYYPGLPCKVDEILNIEDLNPFWLSLGEFIISPWFLVDRGNNLPGGVVDLPRNWMVI